MKLTLIAFLILSFTQSFLFSKDINFEKSILNFRKNIKNVNVNMKVNKSVKLMDADEIEDLLDSNNDAVKLSALEKAKYYLNDSDILDRVIEIYEDEDESVKVRIRAVKTLSYAGNLWKVQDSIKDEIKRGDLPVELKIISYKSLWYAASVSWNIQDFLKDAFKFREEDKDVKKAVLWAMFAASNNSAIQDLLLDVVKYNDDIELKIEAVKSLYLAMHNSSVKDEIYDIAKYKTSPEYKELRKIAILALSAVNNSWDVKDLLEDIYKYDRDDEIRQVAFEALNPDPFKINSVFHLSYKLENGAFYNPVERE